MPSLRPTLLLAPLLCLSTALAQTEGGGVCAREATAARRAAIQEAHATYDLSVGRALGIADTGRRADALDLAMGALHHALDLAERQYQARLLACERLGDAPYDPVVVPARFRAEVDHPYFPLQPGTTWRYERRDADGGVEELVMRVTGERRTILGVECTVVYSRSGEEREETDEFFAQDADGNVWLFGEAARYYDEDGYLLDVGASWLAGRDGAKPGIFLPAAPRVGRSHRLAFLLGVVEDVFTTVSVDALVSVPVGTYGACLEVLETSAEDPTEIGFKSFAPGVGLVREDRPEGGTALELVEFTRS